MTKRSLIFTAVFGTFWGLSEASLGTVLHALRIPLSGSILSGIGLVILLIARIYNPTRGSSLLMGIIAGIIKIISFSTIKLGPFIGIVMEGVIVELVMTVLGPNRTGFLSAGFLVGVYPIIQNVITKTILFGMAFVPVILELAEGFSRTVGLNLGWWLLGLYVAIHIIIGLTGAFLAWRLAQRVAAILNDE